MPLLRADDVQVVLLEMQPPIVAASRTLPGPALRRAAAAVRSLADTLDIPVLASTVSPGGGTAVLIDELGPADPLVRSSIGLLDDRPARDRLAAGGREVLAVGGVSAEIAVLHAVLGARRAGYDVHVLTDCCGGLSERTEAAALRRMEAAGAVVSSVPSFFTSLVDDTGSDHGRAVMGAMARLWSWDVDGEGERAAARIDALLAELRAAWRAGDPDAFSSLFAAEARFVAFDGTTLAGPEAIAAFHARPFATHLAGTELVLDGLTTRRLGDDLWLVASRGGIVRDGDARGDLAGASAQTFLIRTTGGAPRVEAFQNTRARPIDGPRAAEIWREFDRAWFADDRRRS